MVGYLSVSRKSAERRWVSRSGVPVVIVVASMVTSTVEFSGCASSATMVPAMPVKWPFTVVNIMCLTANSTIGWAELRVGRASSERVVQGAEQPEELDLLVGRQGRELLGDQGLMCG